MELVITSIKMSSVVGEGAIKIAVIQSTNTNLQLAERLATVNLLKTNQMLNSSPHITFNPSRNNFAAYS